MSRPALSPPRSWTVALTAVLVLVGAASTGAALTGAAGAATSTDPPVQSEAATDDVATWGASADRIGRTLTDQTVRNIVHTSIPGSNLRVSLSNVFGSQAVTFDDVYVGRQATGADVVPGSNRQAMFNGGSAVTVPAGAEVLSDPIPGTVPDRTNLAVSVHVQGASGTLTGHNLAVQTSYVSPAGDQAAAESGAAFTSQISNWYWVDALVVQAPREVDTLATLGDSITDGAASTKNANHRWPDYLAQRILTLPAPRRLGVLNEGISGNKVLADGAGVSAQARLDRDVLSQPDVHTMVLMEGINDIGGRIATSADQLISAYHQIIARAHADHVCVIGGTMTPYEGAGYYTPEGEQIREQANDWIRTSGEVDSVVDFDKATRDPANPRRFLPAYDSGDHLHPKDAGYQAMANAFDLGQLACSR
jgi:lysophospholipase L1-like esterase